MVSQNLWIRLDASARIGTGHFYRCAALAEALEERGHRVGFLCRKPDALQASQLEAQGLHIRWLPVAVDRMPANEWLSTSVESDIHDSLSALEGEAVDGVLVDHYGLDAQWESAIAQHSARPWVFAIDDLEDRPHSAQGLLNQNYFSSLNSAPGRLNPERIELRGPRYALLRKEFRQLRSLHPRQEHFEQIRKVLVFFGGVDLPGLTDRMLDAIAGLNLEGVRFDVVVGQWNPLRKRLEDKALQLDSVQLLNASPEFSQWVAQADLVVGAGGSTTWERCALGAPSLVVAIAENQRRTSEEMDKDGFHCYLGFESEITPQVLSRALLEACAEPGKVSLMGARSAELVDAMGTVRVCEALESIGEKWTK